MSSDPVILDVLASICKDALQLFERIVIVFDDKEERRANICISKHFIYFVNREMSKLIDGRERISYLDIRRAVVDSSTNRYFLLELRPSQGSSWSGTRILVQSTHRELLLQKIAQCWQAEVMYRLFDVRKFEMVKAALGEQLAAVKNMMAKQSDLIKIEPFRGYEDSFSYRGYGFWLRKGFASASGLKDGVFQNDEGWEVSYKAQPVSVPPGVRVMVHVDNEQLIMDLEKSRDGMEDLRTVAMEYQRSLTENLDQFYVVVSGQYLKKMNRTDDIASWDGWEFFVRSKETLPTSSIQSFVEQSGRRLDGSQSHETKTAMGVKMVKAERDFRPFHQLSAWDAERTKHLCRSNGQACFVVQIRNGQVFISEEQPGFQSRNRLTMAMLHRVSAKFGPLPDAEFVVDTSDGYAQIEAPMFVIAKFPESAGGILYPDFSSYAWPESECPSEPAGAHVWSQVLAKMTEVPLWSEKTDSLFWRGAATSTYRKQVVPFLASLEKANVSMMEWVIGPEGQRQVVSSGSASCVPIHEWCQHRFLANLPGNTMALALKYRLLCGSVVLSSPFLYHEWYYSQLKEGEHFLSFDLRWSGVEDILQDLRSSSSAVAEVVSARSRHWAQVHLTDDGFDCYWLQLIHLASQHFPRPQQTSQALPVESVMLGMSPVLSDLVLCQQEAQAPQNSLEHPLPTRSKAACQRGRPHSDSVSSYRFATDGSCKEMALKQVKSEGGRAGETTPGRCIDEPRPEARAPWQKYWQRDLQLIGALGFAPAQHTTACGPQAVSHRHFFVIASTDPDIELLWDSAMSSDREDDLLVVECQHGYRQLLQKMIVAYRTLLERFVVKFFIRADVDSMLPLHFMLPLLQHAADGNCIVLLSDRSNCGADRARWKMPAIGRLQCQVQCAMDRGCHYFHVSPDGDCATFSQCTLAMASGEVFEYGLHGNSQPCEGLHGSQNVTCIWEEAVKACVADKCTDCGEHECQLCQQESVKVSHCCTANSHPDSEPPQMCKEAMLAEEIKACIGVQCAGCAGQECAACEHRPSVVSSCCDGDFHSALAPPQCRNTTSTSPCARLVGQEALTCAWAEDVRTCIEAGCSSCAGDCPNCRDDSFRISACCDQHFHPAAAPPICAQAILTEDVKRCVAARFWQALLLSRTSGAFNLMTVQCLPEEGKVLTNDTHNPQWNNLHYSHDLGLGVYPPYPEASGYAISSDIAAFLASVGSGALSELHWNAWAIEDSAMGTILAGLKFDMLQLPTEIREHIRDIAVVVRCPAQSMTNDTCEVILDECHIIADSISSVYENVGIYKRPLQARLNTLHFTEDGYRWAEGQLGMVPVHRRAALKFLRSVVKILLSEGALWDESIEHDEIFKDVPDMGDPCSVPQEPISEAESLLQTSKDRNERRNAWAARIARYFAYCLDGGIMGERFTFPLLIQSLGRVSSDVDRQMKEVIDFLLHVNKRDAGGLKGWKSNLFLEKKPVSIIAMTKESEAFAEYFFNDIIMRHLLSENYVESELKKRPPGAGVDYAELLAQLLTDESVGLGLRTMVCRHVLGMLGGSHDREDNKFEKTVKQLVPALVKVMVGSNHILMSYATASLVNLSCGRQNMKQLLVSQGVIKMCVKQLKIKHDELTLYTLFLLVNLTKTPHHRYIVVREGGVPLLVDILTSSYQNLRKQRILAEVASVVGQLCNDPETRQWLNSCRLLVSPHTRRTVMSMAEVA
ncbi:POGLUT1 [Symbiodinium natans]|uniref:POGLUT1 protein n=1 Tax=Symbiodinium natans TaxID=878477 RepID=A0A812MJZ7_9DINO|nr:POGLUT1 [Symbiodinium natans]